MDFKKKMKKFFTMTRKTDGGFTLVELIVVIAILAILAGVTVPAYGGYVEKAQLAADQQLLATMNTAFTVACMDKGHYDMTNLPFAPVASNIQTAVTVNSEVNTEFQTYFGGGAFQYYDVLSFSKAQGIFVANTVAAIKEALKNAWDGSSFKEDSVTALDHISHAFETIGGFFAEGFSLDDLLYAMPEEVRNAFGFGRFDMSDDEILAKYCANMTQAQIDALSDDDWKTIRGNAYVLHMAEDAAGRTAEGVMSDVANLIKAMSTPVTDTEIYEYYNKLYPDNPAKDAADAIDKLTVDNIPASIIVAAAKSGVQNTSGVSALGSLYALGVGYFSSEYYTGDGSSLPNFAEFDDVFLSNKGVMSPSNQQGFMNYLGTFSESGELVTAGQAQKDIDAYLNYMNYISSSGVDMTKSDAFGSMSSTILEILAGK